MDKKIINFKADKAMREAIRKVSYDQGHSNKSRTIVDILEADPLISKELKKLRKKVA